MRILILSTWWPEPADNGSRMRIMQLLRALGAHHELHLLAFTQGPVAEARHEELSRLCVSATGFKRPGRALTVADRLQSLFVAEPSSVRATWCPTFAEAVARAAAQLRPDVVLAMQIDMAPYARRLQHVPRILEELELSYIFDHYRQYQSPLLRLRYLLTALKHRRYVAALLRDFAAVTVVSAREAARVGQLIGRQAVEVAIIPNGADLGASTAYSYQPEPDTLIYPGALSYEANLDAARYFLAEIFPLIRKERPRTTLRITGRSTPEQRAALPTLEGVELTGYVDDVRPLVARSTVEIVPLREGGGTRLKILEALALGTPVISTSKGVEGLDLEPGRHVLVADTPHDFAAATLRLLADPDLCRQLSKAGRQAVAERYDWAVLAPRLNTLIETIIRKSHAYALA